MSLPHVLYWFYTAIILVVGILTLWKGGPAERLAASLILTLILLGRLIELVVPRDVYPVLHLIEDGLTALGLLGIAVRYASFWLGGAMILYGALFTLRAIYFVLDIKPNDLYDNINNVCFMGVIAFMAIATGMAWRARVRGRVEAEKKAKLEESSAHPNAAS